MFDFEGLNIAAWDRLEAGAEHPADPMRLVVLATVDAGGAPEARTMVLRGADRRNGKLWLYTDRRSGKVRQIQAHPAVTVVAFDRGGGVQLRVRGTATVHDSDAQADLHWSQAKLSLQAIFSAREPPGSPLRPDPRLAGIRRSLAAGQEAGARANFAVIEVSVRQIEWLQVAGDEQRRALLDATGGASPRPIAP